MLSSGVLGAIGERRCGRMGGGWDGGLRVLGGLSEVLRRGEAVELELELEQEWHQEQEQEKVRVCPS